LTGATPHGSEKVPEAQLDERIERKQIAAEIAKFWPDDQMKASDVLRCVQFRPERWESLQPALSAMQEKLSTKVWREEESGARQWQYNRHKGKDRKPRSQG